MVMTGDNYDDGARPDSDDVPGAGSISRRRFLAGLGALSGGAALGAAGGRLPWRSAGPLERGARGALRLPAAGWAKSPVSFVFLDTTEPNTLDPSMQSEFDGMLIIRNTYDCLTWTNESTSTLDPWLATSWKQSASGLQWVFTIRSGVKFQDGSSLDAAAVVTSMNRHLAIGSPAQAGYMLAGITKVQETGPMEVTFTTKGPQPWLPAHMAMFPIISAQAIDAHKTSSDPWAKAYFNDHCVGTGAYQLGQWVRGTKIVLTKNPSWWKGPWQPGSLDTVTVQWESDPGTSAELIESGTANFATEWSIDNALTVGKRPGFTLHTYHADNTDPMVAFNQAIKPWDNKLLRQACVAAFDYDAVRSYFRGYSTPTTGVLPPFNPYALKSLPVNTQDIGKAKSLLAQSGVDVSTLPATCYTAAGYPDLVAGGTILQASLAQIGIQVKLQSLPFGSIETAVSKVSTSPPLTSSLYNSIFSLDPTSFLSSFLPGAFGNEFMNYNSSELVAAYNQASASASTDAVKAGLDKAQQVIHDDAPVIFG
ncbi:MAG TPA: ABC transporter substrate-binding protein, partial [Acidimicrobiales bacterium]|nr:ABC transporter substrate-binding protein [Acidimicrobiales bacterium]